MKLEELRVYQLSMSLAEEIWDIVIKWDYFTKDAMGKQLIKAADSIAARLKIEGLMGRGVKISTWSELITPQNFQ